MDPSVPVVGMVWDVPLLNRASYDAGSNPMVIAAIFGLATVLALITPSSALWICGGSSVRGHG